VLYSKLHVQCLAAIAELHSGSPWLSRILRLLFKQEIAQTYTKQMSDTATNVRTVATFVTWRRERVSIKCVLEDLTPGEEFQATKPLHITLRIRMRVNFSLPPTFISIAVILWDRGKNLQVSKLATAISIMFETFWIVTPSGLLYRHKRFRGNLSLHFIHHLNWRWRQQVTQKHWYLSNYKASESRRR
jgi:hypothetical protein